MKVRMFKLFCYICSAQPHHSGNYTCKPSSSTPASIQLFVLGESLYFFILLFRFKIYHIIISGSNQPLTVITKNCSWVAFFWSPALTRTEFKSYGLILMLLQCSDDKTGALTDTASRTGYCGSWLAFTLILVYI